MEGDDINIVIGAQDDASVVLEKVAKKVEENVKQIKGTGEATKKSTELFGVLANTMGQAGLGQYAGQFANLTEKASQFSEVMKAGNTGALAFKAGLAGLVGVIAFKVGSAIGDVIFQTEKWKRELQDATTAADELNQSLLAMSSTIVSNERADIELIQDPEAKKAAYKELFDTVSNNLIGIEEKVKAGRAEVEVWNNAWFDFMGANKQAKEESIKQLEVDEKRLKLAQEQRNELQGLLGTRQADLEAQRQANAEQSKSDTFIANLKSEIELLSAKKGELNEIIAANNTSNLAQAGQAQALLDQRDKLKQAQQDQIDKERQAAQQAAENARKRQADADRDIANAQSLVKSQISVIEQLEMQAITLRDGKEAAEQYRLELQGFSKDEAATLAALSETLNEPDKKISNAGPLNATEGRLLTRGPQDDPIARNTAELVNQGGKQARVLDATLRTLEKIEAKKVVELWDVSV